VYRAWFFHRPDGPRASDPPIPVALKVLRAQPGLADEALAFFKREAEALQRLSHPNITRLFDVFDQGGAAMMVIELVDGETLESVIARHVARARLAGHGALPGVPFQRAWYYFEQLLGALAAVHAIGIVHRDVKPANVLVRRDGIVKLTDFGIAKVPAAAAPDVSRMDPGSVPGTGAYMSPEQVLARPLDGRSDLYSATIVLYEMVCGRPPFTTDEKSEYVIRQEQASAVPPPPSRFLPQAPAALDALMARALAKDPEARFPSAIHLGNAFREALGLPESAGWSALVALASEAPTTEREPEAAQKRMGTLRDVVVARYRTAPLPARS
jgi:serine/threonine-protein kinase